MYARKSLLSLFLLVVLVLAACGGSALPEAAMEEESAVMANREEVKSTMEESDAEGMMKEGDAEGMMKEGDAEDVMKESAETTMDLPAWFSVDLTDVNSGETFTVADLQGKVILIETMAIWCPNCLRQQKEVKALHETLGERDDLVTLVLDIDPNEDGGNLKDYAARNGFTWTYVVAPREVAREIGQLYGDEFLNPPSTPMLIVDRHGEVHLLPFGRKSAADLQEALAPFLEEGM
jgi:cytochrome oxidase Cu insertion factor (SCO1/SenC/PrrC family)